MIRIELPPTILPRLRLRWHVTHAQFLRRSRALREYAERTAAVSREYWQHTSEKVAARLSLRSRLRTRALLRQRVQIARFEERYEMLIDLLCCTARDGVHSDCDARYTEVRAWMQAHYRALRPRLRPYWADQNALDTHDPFEALFAPANIADMINATTGIEDMMRTRAALETYRDALEARACNR